jgi:RND family efflux transporter MFP subunit
VQLVQPRPIERIDSATYQSTLEAIRELRLAPEISGRIVAMPVYEGQEVKPGQLLFSLDQVQLQSEVNADAAEARKNQVNAERYIFLNEQGAVSTKDRDFYVTQAIQSRDKLRASLATLGYKNVVAPIAGYVGNLNYKLGDVIQAGSVVTSVIDNSKLWVRIDVPAPLSDRLRRGLPVLLQGPDPGRPRAVGQVVFIAPSLDKERQTLLVKAAFANPDGSLRNNERVSATVLFSRQPVLAIPEQAVLLQAGKPFVFLAVSINEAQMRLGRTLKPSPPADLPVVVQVPVQLCWATWPSCAAGCRCNRIRGWAQAPRPWPDESFRHLHPPPRPQHGLQHLDPDGGADQPAVAADREPAEHRATHGAGERQPAWRRCADGGERRNRSVGGTDQWRSGDGLHHLVQHQPGHQPGECGVQVRHGSGY